MRSIKRLISHDFKKFKSNYRFHTNVVILLTTAVLCTKILEVFQRIESSQVFVYISIALIVHSLIRLLIIERSTKIKTVVVSFAPIIILTAVYNFINLDLDTTAKVIFSLFSLAVLTLVYALLK